MSKPIPAFFPESHSLNVGIAVETGSCWAALVFNHVFFWLKTNKFKNHNQIDGRTWMYESIPAIALHFPYLTQKQIKDGLHALVEHGYLIKDNHSQDKFDKTNWYAVADENWLDIQKIFSKRPTGPMRERTEREKEHSKNVCDETYRSHRENLPVPSTEASPYYTDNKHTYNKDNICAQSRETQAELAFVPLATSFFEKLKKINPKVAKPKSFKDWAKELEAISKKSGDTSIEDIGKVIDYVISTKESPSSNGFCWANIILNPAKLKKNFAQLWAEMTNSQHNVNVQTKTNSLHVETMKIQNRKLAEKIWDLCKKDESFVRLGSSYLEIIPGGQIPSLLLYFNDSQFREIALRELKKKSINTENL